MFYDNAPIYDYERRGCGAEESVAVLVCENCRESCDRLTHVPEWDYMGCGDCMEEAMAVLERERLAAIAAPRKCANCASQARRDSIYCSDRCKHAFLNSFSTEAA
jgi:hypothetical protein